MIEIEELFNEPVEELLRRKYVDENKTIQTISSEIGVHYEYAQKWLKKAGIYSKHLLR